MKRVILLITAFLMVFVLTAQHNQHQSMAEHARNAYLKNHNLGFVLPQSAPNNSGLITKTEAITTKLDSIRFKYYDMGSWEMAWKYLYTYDGSGLCTEEEEWEWDGGTWEPRYLYTFMYDANGNVTTMIYHEWDAGAFKPYYKTEITYNVSNQVIEEVEAHWDSVQWQPSWRMTVDYGSNGFAQGDTSYSWDGTDWMPDGRRSYMYNAGNLLIERTSQYNYGGWTNDMKKVFDYDASDKLVRELEYGWSNNNWQINSKDTMSFDVYGFMNLRLDYYWSNGSWQPNDKLERINDASGNILSEIYSFWNNAAWLLDEKVDATYDASTPMTEIGAPYWFKEEFKAKLLDYKSFNYNGSSWDPDEDADPYYSSFIEVPIYNQAIIKVYPNPAKDVLIVESDNAIAIEVFNLLGQTVYESTAIAGKNTIDLTGLASGVYIVRLANHKTVKFIKQ